MMTSSNSKERFKAEYYQLKIRHEELIKMENIISLNVKSVKRKNNCMMIQFLKIY